MNAIFSYEPIPCWFSSCSTVNIPLLLSASYRRCQQLRNHILSTVPEQSQMAAPPSTQAATDRYWEALVDCGYDEQNNPFVARFGRLSRLNITFLFNELIVIKADIRNGHRGKEQMDRLALCLHHYGEYR